MAEAKRFDSIAEIGREAWNACVSGALEDYDYFLAIERSHIKDFTHAYYAMVEDGTVLAVLPLFFTQYDLVTTAEGWVKTLLSAIKRVFPSLMLLKLACLGCAETECCPIGMHPSCPPEKKCLLFEQLLQCFEEDAEARHISLLGIKDVSTQDTTHYAAILDAHGFCGVAGQPTALLPIDFSSIDDYLSRLSAATRKDLRRKLRKRNDIRIEYRQQIDDVLKDVYAMYLETKARSDWQFEELTRDYFREVLNCMGERGLCAVYFHGDRPVAANLMLLDHERLLDKFFCMRRDEGRAYNLYFLSWLANLQLCLDRGLRYYQSGQAGYETKLRLGSRLLENRIYFRHRHRIANRLLRLISPLLAFTPPKGKTA